MYLNVLRGDDAIGLSNTGTAHDRPVPYPWSQCHTSVGPTAHVKIG